jgi:hypothetical protein
MKMKDVHIFDNFCSLNNAYHNWFGRGYLFEQSTQTICGNERPRVYLGIFSEIRCLFFASIFLLPRIAEENSTK